MKKLRTQVGIVGAGPAGLMLSHLLHLQGIESVVVKNRSQQYVQERVRAGVLEQGTVDLMIETGVGERLKKEGLVHYGVNLRFGRRTHRIDFADLTGGKGITIYAQHEVIKDLNKARREAGGQILLRSGRCERSRFRGGAMSSTKPSIRFVATENRTSSPVISSRAATASTEYAGRVSRKICSRIYDRTYPFGWLGILADAPPSWEELVYTYHERGFALLSMRSPK